MNKSGRGVIVFTANRGFALTRSRGLLIRRLVDRGWRVVVATRQDAQTSELLNLGAEFEPVEFARGGLSSWADLRALFSLRSIYQAHRPRLIHNFNAKPIILGSVAAAGIRPRPVVVNTLTGLGHSLTGGSSSILARLGYRWTGRRATVTIFQNHEDERLFLDQGYTAPRRSRLIIGSGVDTEEFKPRERARRRGTVVMVTRLLNEKGVRDYLEAARRVRRQRPEVRFALAGEWEDDHPDAVPRRLVAESVEAGDVDFLGYVDDLNDSLPTYSLFVFPSYYREGVPRVLLEASACGLPLVAADMAGAREVIRHGETGWLVPPRAPRTLAETILDLISDDRKLLAVGRRAREQACERFNIRQITTRYLEVYEDLGFDVGELPDG